MPASQLVMFGIWLTAAVVGGVLLVIVWQRLHAKFERRSRRTE